MFKNNTLKNNLDKNLKTLKLFEKKPLATFYIYLYMFMILVYTLTNFF